MCKDKGAMCCIGMLPPGSIIQRGAFGLQIWTDKTVTMLSVTFFFGRKNKIPLVHQRDLCGV